MHRAGELADRVAACTRRDPARILAQLTGKRIHRAEAIPLYAFDRSFIDSAAAVERRNTVTLSVAGRLLSLDLNGTAFGAPIHEYRLT